MNFEKRKTSTKIKITFKTFQPHNAAGQREVREREGRGWLQQTFTYFMN